MKQCPNCKGALDNNGKCLACGTVTRLDLSDKDGKVLNKIPEELEGILGITKITSMKMINKDTGKIIMELEPPTKEE